MPFRNPTTTLPGSAITGPIDGGQLIPGSVAGPALAPGGVTFPNLESAIMAALSQKWWDFGDGAAKWTKQGTPTIVSVPVADGSAGVAMRVSGYAIMWRPDIMVPFDPNALYRISVTVRQTVAGSSTANQRVYFGAAGFAADRATFVNNTGANSSGSQAYCAARGTNLTAGGPWQTFTGYIKGYAATTGDAGPNPSVLAPMAVHPSVRYLSPLLYLNYTGGTGVAEVDTVSIEVVPTGPVDGAVHIMPGTVIADRLSADAIDGKTVTGLVMNTGELNGVQINGVDIIGTSTVTGAVVQTAASGPRLVMSATGLAVRDAGSNLVAAIVPEDTTGRSAFVTYDTRFGKEYYGALTAGDLRLGVEGVTTEETEAFVSYSSLGGGLYELLLSSGSEAVDVSPGQIHLYSADADGAGNARIHLGADQVDVAGVLTAKNIKSGRASVTTVANTPTPYNVTGLGLSGTNFRALATASSTVSGTSVLGVGTTNPTADAVTLWVTRVNTGPTTVDYLVIGD